MEELLPLRHCPFREVLKPTIPSDMADFTQYYESTWIETPGSPAKFDPACWNQHDSVLAGLPRSSNIAEGWHIEFKFLLQCTNPTLWAFLDPLKLEQGLTDQKIADRLMLRAPELRAEKWIEVDQKLEEKIVAYDNDRYEILECYCSIFEVLHYCCVIGLYHFIILLNYYIMYILTMRQ